MLTHYSLIKKGGTWSGVVPGESKGQKLQNQSRRSPLLDNVKRINTTMSYPAAFGRRPYALK